MKSRGGVKNQNRGKDLHRLEEKRLALEIKQLQTPFYKNTSFWIGAVTALAATFGIIYQSQISEVKKERALLAVERAQKLENKVKSEILTLTELKEKSELEVVRLTKSIESSRSKLSAIKNDIENATKHGNTENRSTFEKAIVDLEDVLTDLPVTPRATATIASWNIENAWRGISDNRAKLIARALGDMDADVSVLLEMSYETSEQLVEAMSKLGLCYRFQLLEQLARQKISLFFRCGTEIEVKFSELIDGSNAGRRGLRNAIASHVRIGKFDFVLIGVHLKSKVGGKTELIRQTQAKAISSYISNLETIEKDVLIIGDYNFDAADEIETARALATEVNIVFPELEKLSSKGTYLFGGRRILIDGFAFAFDTPKEYILGSVDIVPLDVTLGLSPEEFKEEVSDHLPIISRFRTYLDSD